MPLGATEHDSGWGEELDHVLVGEREAAKYPCGSKSERRASAHSAPAYDADELAATLEYKDMMLNTAATTTSLCKGGAKKSRAAQVDHKSISASWNTIQILAII